MLRKWALILVPLIAVWLVIVIAGCDNRTPATADDEPPPIAKEIPGATDPGNPGDDPAAPANPSGTPGDPPALLPILML